jgi:hypothetical protein
VKNCVAPQKSKIAPAKSFAAPLKIKIEAVKSGFGGDF